MPLLKNLSSDDALVQGCLDVLRGWDLKLAPGSAAAAVYFAWQRALLEALYARLFPPEFAGSVPGRSLAKLIGWVEAADPRIAPRGRNFKGQASP